MIRLLILLFISWILFSGCTLTNQQQSQHQSTNTQIPLKTLYVDVREDDEWAAWHIDWALHVKLGDIEAGKLDAIPKDVPVALYCRSGRRSGIAYDILSKAWYTNIRDAGAITNIAGERLTK